MAGFMKAYQDDVERAMLPEQLVDVLSRMTRDAGALPVPDRQLAKAEVAPWFQSFRSAPQYADVWQQPVPTAYKDLMVALTSTTPPAPTSKYEDRPPPPYSAHAGASVESLDLPASAPPSNPYVSHATSAPPAW